MVDSIQKLSLTTEYIGHPINTGIKGLVAFDKANEDQPSSNRSSRLTTVKKRAGFFGENYEVVHYTNFYSDNGMYPSFPLHEGSFQPDLGDRREIRHKASFMADPAIAEEIKKLE